MAYLYEDIATTTRGKIIYRRKHHPFSICDARRIIVPLEFPEERREMLCFIDALDAMLLKLPYTDTYALPTLVPGMRDTLSLMRSDAELWPEEGGGSFGASGRAGVFIGIQGWWVGFGLPFKP